MLPDPSASRAVLVGVDTYTSLPSLPTAPEGARRLARLLREEWDLPERHVTVLGAKASADAVLSAVRDAALATRDTLVVYFAGHGLRDRPGEHLYLGLTGADPDYPRVGTLAYRDLRHVLRQTGARARYRLTVLDCCYSGLAGAMGPQVEATRDELADALDEPVTPDGGPLDHYGDVVLTSAPHNRKSFAPPGAPCPEATGELIRVLESGVPGAGPEVSVNVAWQLVRRRLLARGSPEPQQFAQNKVADVLGFPNRAVEAVAPAGVSEEARRSIVRLTDFSTGVDQAGTGREGLPSAVLASAPEPDWWPVPVGQWRPENEPPYPGDEYFDQQMAHRSLLDTAWADLKEEFRTVRRRLRVPLRIRALPAVATWLHQSTGDIRWVVVADSVRALEDRKSGYQASVVSDPYAAQIKEGRIPPRHQLTMGTVNAYRGKVDQLRADIEKLTGLHADGRK